MARWSWHLRSVCVALPFTLLLAGCTTVHINVPRTASYSWPQPHETALGRLFAEQLARADGKSGIHLLASGTEALGVRAALAERAQHTLDLQYYIVRDDATSHLLLHRVLSAAERGVRVRILVDDMYAAGNELHLARFAAHPNVEIRIYNAFAYRGPLALMRVVEFLADPARLNRRMHNKLWIADNAAAIVGGRNLGDEYFDAHSDRNFADLDVFAAGPVVRELSRSFDEYWNSEWALPIEAFLLSRPGPEALAELERDLQQRLQALSASDYSAPVDFRLDLLRLATATATVVFDDPGKIQDQREHDAPVAAVVTRVRPLIESAQREVILISPYFIPSETAVAMLTRLTARGVRVRVLTNSLASTDAPVVHAAYARFRARLLAAGCEMHEMRPDRPRHVRGRARGPSSGASLHAKAIVVDRKHAMIGSMNLDPRSRIHNTEIGVLLQSEEVGAEVATFFEEAVKPAHAFQLAAVSGGSAAEMVWIGEESGRAVRYDRDPLAGWWRRLLTNVLSVLAPEHLL